MPWTQGTSVAFLPAPEPDNEEAVQEERKVCREQGAWATCAAWPLQGHVA